MTWHVGEMLDFLLLTIQNLQSFRKRRMTGEAGGHVFSAGIDKKHDCMHWLEQILARGWMAQLEYRSKLGNNRIVASLQLLIESNQARALSSPVSIGAQVMTRSRMNGVEILWSHPLFLLWSSCIASHVDMPLYLRDYGLLHPPITLNRVHKLQMYTQA